MTRIAHLLCCLLLLPAGEAAPRSGAPEARACGTRTEPAAARAGGAVFGTGGRYLTAGGTLRVLLVFASFPDDERPHPYWPAHHAPLSMQEFIDPDTTVHSTGPFNLTHYFRQMSLGQLHVVGEALWVEAAHPQTDYANGSFARANIGLLQERVDPLVDFGQYDAWTQREEYLSERTPDGQVDMVVMIWRTDIFEFAGEASLGYRPAVIADGKRIETGYPGSLEYPKGSGITCQYLFNDHPAKLLRTIVHELGHWLLGGMHPYSDVALAGKHEYWGMLCSGHRLSSCANAYERERLGWIRVPEVPQEGELVLPDYLTTGIACKYHPVNGEPGEYFYFENHQGLSVFDDVTLNPSDRGLWILHQRGEYLGLDNLRIEASDGRWDWEAPWLPPDASAQEPPVFMRGAPGVLGGASHRDMLVTRASAVNWMTALAEPGEPVHRGAFFAGERFSGAFSRATAAVFSPYSNPSSSVWGALPSGLALELLGEAGGHCTVRFVSDPLLLSPARRSLGAHPLVPQVRPGPLTLAWGPEWPDGQPLEPDVSWSELERRVGAGGGWMPVYQGSATAWKEPAFTFDTAGTVPVSYRSRVRDAEGKSSAWSNTYTAMAAAPAGITGGVRAEPGSIALLANYPNPFNPSTTISFNLQGPLHVRLTVVDLLGRPVRELIDADMFPGTHALVWDGADSRGRAAASGLYFSHLRAGPFTLCRPMVLSR